MKNGPMILVISMVFILSFACCCCSALGLGDNFGEAQLQTFLEDNLESVIEEAEVDIDQIVGTPTPPSPGEEAGDAAESAAEATEDQEVPAEPEPEAPTDMADSEEEAAQEILEALEQHLEAGGEAPFAFGCDDSSIPMPGDIEGCVSVAGFTTYSTGMSETDINRLYDEFFLGQGWEHFPAAIQEDVLNAWQKEGVQGYAFLAFTPEGGENGKNMVNLAVITE